MRNIIIVFLMFILPSLAMAQGQITRKPVTPPPTHKHSVNGPKDCTECNRLRQKRIEEQRRKEQERIAEQQRLEEQQRREEEQRLAEERKRREEEKTRLAEQKRIIDNLVDNMVYVENYDFIDGYKSFSIGKYEVTQAEWKAVMGNNPSKFKGDNLPVEQVSWDDCLEFIRKLNVITEKNFRLPTGVEWGFAACGGNSSRDYKYSGSNDIDSVAWHNANSGNKTHHVGLKKPNELGLYDMSGNVYEWCQDWYNSKNRTITTEEPDTITNPKRVARGGCYDSSPDEYKLSKGSIFPPNEVSSGRGFRLACSLNENELIKPSDEQLRVVERIINNMVYVEKGTFTMGANHHGDNARPAHKVTLTKPYYICKYEVTQAEWKTIMGSNPSYYKEENLPNGYETGDNFPVENVSWKDCKLFIKKLNIIIGDDVFILPTEEEWEFAARGGNSSRGYKYSGSNDLNAVAWYEDNSSKHTHPVGKKASNELGLYDMTGNVEEWCDNSFYSYHKYYSPSLSPIISFMIRGGCFYSNKYSSYVDARSSFGMENRYRHIGLRLAAYVNRIYGNIVDEDSKPLAGASIFVLNTNDIVVSDANGSFSLESNKIAPMIKVICPGYDDKIIRGTSNMKIKMTPK